MTNIDAGVAYYRELIRPIFVSRPWLLFQDQLFAIAEIAQQLQSLGCDKLMVLGAGPETLEPSEFGGATVVPLSHLQKVYTECESLSHVFATFEEFVVNLPEEPQGIIDTWDPQHHAFAATKVVLGTFDQVAGRRFYGARKKPWEVYEDKTQVDAFWQRCGLPCAPSLVVDANEESLIAAHQKLDQGKGCVWSGDLSKFVHGGGNGIRWVTSSVNKPNTIDNALSLFSSHYQRVRIMPYLEGISCSIHGIVFNNPDDTLVLKPIEMVVYPDPESGRFQYAGCASHWEAPPKVRKEMRAMTKQVGKALHAEADYRGPFTIDGVLTEQGFFPTELNARIGAAMNLFSQGAPEFPLSPLCWTIIENEKLDFRPPYFEKLLLEIESRGPVCRCHAVCFDTIIKSPKVLELRKEENQLVLASFESKSSESESFSTDFRIHLSPIAGATLIRFEPLPHAFPRSDPNFDPTGGTLGTPLGPWIQQAHALALEYLHDQKF